MKFMYGKKLNSKYWLEISLVYIKIKDVFFFLFFNEQVVINFLSF